MADDIPLPRRDPRKPTPEQRAYGLDELKRKMLSHLGIDNPKGVPFDDTPTIEDRLRRAESGKPDIFDLQEQERQMEKRQRSSIPGDEFQPDSPYGVVPLPRNINLHPIEHNPFATTLVPIDDDPFSGTRT